MPVNALAMSQYLAKNSQDSAARAFLNIYRDIVGKDSKALCTSDPSTCKRVLKLCEKGKWYAAQEELVHIDDGTAEDPDGVEGSVAARVVATLDAAVAAIVSAKKKMSKSALKKMSKQAVKNKKLKKKFVKITQQPKKTGKAYLGRATFTWLSGPKKGKSASVNVNTGTQPGARLSLAGGKLWIKPKGGEKKEWGAKKDPAATAKAKKAAADKAAKAKDSKAKVVQKAVKKTVEKSLKTDGDEKGGGKGR